MARWPALAYPWLSGGSRKRSELPPLAAGCEPDELSTGLRIGGLNDGSVLRTPSNRSGPIRARVQALGSDGLVSWLLNDRFIGQTTGTDALELTFADSGDQRLVAIDSGGRYAATSIRTLVGKQR